MKNVRYKVIKNKPLRYTYIQKTSVKKPVFGYTFHLFDFSLIILSVFMLYKTDFSISFVLTTGIISFLSCFHKK